MDITKTILKRATIQGLADYLIYGTAIESKRQEKQVDYDERLAIHGKINIRVNRLCK